MIKNQEKNILKHLEMLEKQHNFFNNVDEINKFNIDAIIELIQYKNIKELGEPMYTRREIRQGLREYFSDRVTC